MTNAPANDNRRGNTLPRSLAPRGLSREVAAAYIDVSPTTFDRMVADGTMPKPKQVYSRRIWDRAKIDRAFSAIPGDDGDVNDEWDVA